MVKRPEGPNSLKAAKVNTAVTVCQLQVVGKLFINVKIFEYFKFKRLSLLSFVAKLNILVFDVVRGLLYLVFVCLAFVASSD